jgi:putative membrane protein
MSRRWPAWIYDHGEEPDYRFSFANERTFLAWIRTALALVAAGVALDVVDLPGSSDAQEVAAIALILLGMIGAGFSWIRWALAERAIRRSGPLPSFGFGGFFALVVIVVALVLLLAGL